MATGFRVPAMPLVCNVWHAPNAPPAAPDIANLQCQLRGPAQHPSGLSSVFASVVATPALLVTALTDIRDYANPNGTDTVECPAGSGRFYLIQMVEDVGKGFLNEHRFAALVKTGMWPVPIP
jgi:hypothetical protein